MFGDVYPDDEACRRVLDRGLFGFTDYCQGCHRYAFLLATSGRCGDCHDSWVLRAFCNWLHRGEEPVIVARSADAS